jgi:DNA-binding NtrC family response regulator
MLPRVLLLVPTPALADRLLGLTEAADFVTALAQGNGEPWQVADTPDCDVAVVHRAALGPRPVACVERIRALSRAPAVIVLEEREDAKERAELVAAGCLAVLATEAPDGALREALGSLIAGVAESLARGRLAEEAQFRLGDFVSHSPGMQRFLALARRVSQADSSLLILGETGVGKERLARAIHAEGPRAAGPFVDVNCGAIPESLLESELFGHERGAFTGADRAHRGHFERAHRGTIFLDEIAEMPLHLQVKLLRVLQERCIQRIGGERSVPIDVRVIAATNRDLAEEVETGRCRADLFYRLSVVTLTIPPLRERREDIGPLLDNYLKFFAAQMPAKAKRFSDGAYAALRDYSWPGNVRELVNAVERAVLLCEGETIGLDDLPETIAGGWVARTDRALVERVAAPLAQLDDSLFELPLSQARRAQLAAFERTYLDRLLRATGGRIAETARRAGIVPRSLHTKMKDLGLHKEDYRSRRR